MEVEVSYLATRYRSVSFGYVEEGISAADRDPASFVDSHWVCRWWRLSESVGGLRVAGLRPTGRDRVFYEKEDLEKKRISLMPTHSASEMPSQQSSWSLGERTEQ